MAKIKAYYGVDFADFDLNYYKDMYESDRVVIDSKDKTNAGADDRYTIWTTEFDKWAIAFHGRNFGYDGSRKWPTEGRVQAFSEWFYNTTPDESAGEEFGRTRIYLLSDINVPLEDFIDAFRTNRKVDDRALLESILSGNDKFNLSAFDDRAYGHAGNDTMRGFGGNDVLFGNDGDDILKGLGDNDELKGGQGDDVLQGNRGADILKGDAGGDVLKGGRGGDKLNGNAGADTLSGDKGDDILIGGSGNDIFVFKTNGGADTIRDWEATDTIDLSRLVSVVDFADLQTQMSQVGTDVVIDGENGDTLTLRNTDMTTLTEADFIFQ